MTVLQQRACMMVSMLPDEYVKPIVDILEKFLNSEISISGDLTSHELKLIDESNERINNGEFFSLDEVKKMLNEAP